MTYYNTRYQLRLLFDEKKDSKSTNTQNKINVTKITSKETLLEKQIRNRMQKDFNKKLEMFKNETNKKIDALQKKIEELEEKLNSNYSDDNESDESDESDDDVSYDSDESYEPDELECSDDDEIL